MVEHAFGIFLSIWFWIGLIYLSSHKQKYNAKIAAKSNNFYIFAPALVHFRFRRKVIKRESGVSPEQSRCCKLFKRFEQYFCHWDTSPIFPPFGEIRRGVREGVQIREQVRRPARIAYQISEAFEEKATKHPQKISFCLCWVYFRKLFERFIHRQIVYNSV